MKASLLTHRPAVVYAPSGSARSVHLLQRLQRCALDDLDPGAPGIGDISDDVARGGTLASWLVELDAVCLERLEECRMVLHVEADMVEYAMPGRRLRRVGLGEAELAARDIHHRLVVAGADLAAEGLCVPSHSLGDLGFRQEEVHMLVPDRHGLRLVFEDFD